VTDSGFVTAISRSTDKLDIFTVDKTKAVVTAAWNPANAWGGWWPATTSMAQSMVTPVSRSTDKLDIFLRQIRPARPRRRRGSPAAPGAVHGP
jgi:hypothetical protein